MIGLCAALIGLAPLHFVEIPDPKADHVLVEIVAPLIDLNQREQATAQILATTITAGATTYTRKELARYTTDLGYRLRAFANPDHLRIEATCSPPDVVEVLNRLASMVSEATYPDDAVSEASQLLSVRHVGTWATALWPLVPDWSYQDANAVRALALRVLRPEHLSICVCGRFTPGLPKRVWTDRTATWAPPFPPLGRILPPASEITETRRAVDTFDLRGPTFAAHGPSLLANLLAAFALGQGKGSAAAQVIREKLDLSYRQEAVLWPLSSGFQVRVLWASSPGATTDASLDAVRVGLLAAVSNWTEADRSRALAVAEGCLTSDLLLSPLQFDAGVPQLPSEEASRAFLSAYWPMKTGDPWDPAGLLKSLRSVSLAALKATAADIVTRGQFHSILRR